MKKLLAFSMAAVLFMSGLTACQTSNGTSAEPEATKVQEPVTNEDEQVKKNPKYIFLFIGDGMSAVQVNSAQVMNGVNTVGEVTTNNLLFADFPTLGMATTHDSTSFAPDSASTATSISTGAKTHSGVIGMGVDKTTKLTNIAELLKEQGRKIGVVSTVTINHATPAAFYAHVASRNDYYDIAMQMADSNFDYFGGGSINKATGANKDQKSAYAVMEEKGYTVVDTAEDIEALNADSGKVYAVTPRTQDSGAMPYAIDQTEEDLSFADFIRKGIDVLNNDDKGFFLMGEGGKIDWSCHANDAKTTIDEVLDFEAGVQVAVDFAAQHPDETLILVTGDHETGGMTIGYASTGYDTAFDILDAQKMSYVEFDAQFTAMKEENPAMTLEDVMPFITENFGLKMPSGDEEADLADIMVMNEFEVQKLADGFAESLKPADEREGTVVTDLLYGGYDPLSVSVTHIINNKAGIGWTSYAHTGVPVPVYVEGAGAEAFSGFYDNTDIFKALAELTGVNA